MFNFFKRRKNVPAALVIVTRNGDQVNTMPYNDRAKAIRFLVSIQAKFPEVSTLEHALDGSVCGVLFDYGTGNTTHYTLKAAKL